MGTFFWILSYLTILYLGYRLGYLSGRNATTNAWSDYVVLPVSLSILPGLRSCHREVAYRLAICRVMEFRVLAKSAQKKNFIHDSLFSALLAFQI